MKKSKRTLSSLLFVVLLYSVVSTASADTVLLEAESFEDSGGWVVDQQFMDQMGSPFLLAHGLGIPVKDAVTKVRFPSAGKYRVWVRTRDWVAQWKAPGTPGRFQLLIDGKPLKTVFGTEGADWHWQDGGTVEIAKKQTKITLHDLTGFEGRCDAIIFTSDMKFKPPNKGKALNSFRRKSTKIARPPPYSRKCRQIRLGCGRWWHSRYLYRCIGCKTWAAGSADTEPARPRRQQQFRSPRPPERKD
jgi:hypothetical protein